MDRLLDAAAERGTLDLIEDFAAAIPVQLIGDLLGIPQNERGPLRDWSLKILGALEPVLTKEQFDGGVNAVAEFKDYLRDLVARPPAGQPQRKRRNPLDPDRRQRDRRAAAAATGCPSSSFCTTASSCSTPATRPPPT